MAAASVGAQTGATIDGRLKDVTISDHAEAIGGLQKTCSGGQFARGGSLGITDLMNVPFSTTHYTSEPIQNLLQDEKGFFYARSATADPSSLYNPAPLPTIGAARLAPSKSSELTQSSIVIADTMSFADDRFLVTLGLRDQTIEQKGFNQVTGVQSTRYKASSVTPLADLVFKPMKNVSVYTDYTAGLSQGGTAPAAPPMSVKPSRR